MYNIQALQLFEAGMYAGAVPELIYWANHHLESLLQKTLFLNLNFSVNPVLRKHRAETHYVIS